nr:MAG TPA: lipocalin-like protein [Caudoviricetes sp.]DAY52456.1 MAG TPA: lipocalin-like protein [Caudoviricetes sp.]
MVTVKVTENSGASKRTATVNISTPTEFGQVEVTQEGSTI